ncbi:MAG: CarD family transcriptional regulator [Rhodospirillales bacterium]
MAATATKKKVAPPAPKLPFGVGDYVVYPTHGVGKVVGVETATVAGFDLQLYVIVFENDKMTLRVPVEKAKDSGLRKLSSKEKMANAMTTLKGRARAKRTMWSRRAQEYEAKINSGDPVSIAEVVRDLHRAIGQPDQSYSERQMYEAALERLAHELALVEKIDQQTATKRLESMLKVA